VSEHPRKSTRAWSIKGPNEERYISCAIRGKEKQWQYDLDHRGVFEIRADIRQIIGRVAEGGKTITCHQPFNSESRQVGWGRWRGGKKSPLGSEGGPETQYRTQPDRSHQDITTCRRGRGTKVWGDRDNRGFRDEALRTGEFLSEI